MLCALIMAGGKGERFWPLSTEDRPKQFLKLLSEETMLQMTVKRLEKFIPLERIFIVTGKKYTEFVKLQIPTLPERNIIIEPVGKNTAPCIGLSAFIIEKYYKNSTIAVLPSDHLIKQEENFISVLDAAYKFIEDNPEAIVTIGMKPDRPETGYGYIKQYEVYKSINFHEIRKVEKFVEKPDYETAIRYIREGNYLWNGGMFIWKTNTILKLTKKYLNKTYEILNEIAATKDDKFERILEDKYNQLDSISVDYGIMEKTDNIYVIPGDIGWDDVGTWNAVDRIMKKDDRNNVRLGNVAVIDSSDSIVIGDKKQIVVAGLENVFVAESDEVILICDKNLINSIKDIKSRIGD